MAWLRWRGHGVPVMLISNGGLPAAGIPEGYFFQIHRWNGIFFSRVYNRNGFQTFYNKGSTFEKKDKAIVTEMMND